MATTPKTARRNGSEGRPSHGYPDPSLEDINDMIENYRPKHVWYVVIFVYLKSKHVMRDRDPKVQLYDILLKDNFSFVNSGDSESFFNDCFVRCCRILKHHMTKAATLEDEVDQIAMESGNLVWLLDVMVFGQIDGNFINMWASQTDLLEARSKAPPCRRYYLSRVTARLFAKIGKGQGQRFLSDDAMPVLLRNWLVPFCQDYKLMKESKCMEWDFLEEGLNAAILTLPLPHLQEVLLVLVDSYAKSGCPSIQTAFEYWWTRVLN